MSPGHPWLCIMLPLRSLQLKCPVRDEFPFNVPIIRTLETLEFTSQVTLFVGENGSGKSTLLETLACAARTVTIGSEPINTDPTLTQVRKLAKYMKLHWNRKTHRGFFLRAEDYFGYVKNLQNMRHEMQEELERIKLEYRDRSDLARSLASMPYARELQDMQRRYGPDLDAHSHGESYMHLLQSRFAPEGIYLLDEPESALSPTRQLSLLRLIYTMVQQGCQFIIATHSPLLLAYPEATILNFDADQLQIADYHQLNHIQIIKSFIENPETYLRHLID